MEKIDSKPDNQVMRSFKNNSKTIAQSKALTIFIVLLLIGAGVGYGLSSLTNQSGTSLPLIPTNNGAGSGKTFGSDDTKTFKDIAEGKLEKGGVEGEGQYHLVRPGGDSQNVYMTSSTVDLSKFVGKKIKVWGQTQTAQTAGWLMDVGRVEVL